MVANRRLAVIGAGLTATGIIVMAIGFALSSGPGTPSNQADRDGFGPGGMMGFGAANVGSGPGPGSTGFVAGTSSAPRVVRIIAGGNLRFFPDVVSVKQGETITFEVTAMGMRIHEFMVGPAADVAADRDGTPEVADIGMMATKSLTYAFNGPGPYAFACHAPGHYEAGMKGTIVIVP
jgi:uncharacterized cupredoxin-like copper-binding protein